MAFKIILNIFFIFTLAFNAGDLKGNDFTTSGIAYGATSVLGANPLDTPLTNGSPCFLNSQCATPGKYKNILTVGDSHVVGKLNSSTDLNYRGGFRFRIQKEMLPVVVNMLGPNKNNPKSDATFDVDHAGIGGQTTAQINARVPGLIANYLSPATCADTVVVLEGGYNNLSTTEPAFTQQISEIVQSIQRFHDFCPDMPVLFMNLKPNPTNAIQSVQDSIDTYNARLLIVMSDLQETIPNLWIWDRNAIYKDPANCNGHWNNCCQILCTGGCNSLCQQCASVTTHPSPTGYELDGQYIGLIIKNGCLSQYHCRPDPLP